MKIKSQIEISVEDLKTAVQSYLKDKLGPDLLIKVDNLKEGDGDLTRTITVSATLEKYVPSYAVDR